MVAWTKVRNGVVGPLRLRQSDEARQLQMPFYFHAQRTPAVERKKKKREVSLFSRERERERERELHPKLLDGRRSRVDIWRMHLGRTI